MLGSFAIKLKGSLKDMLVLTIDTHNGMFTCMHGCVGMPMTGVEAKDQLPMLFLRSHPHCPSLTPSCQGLSVGPEAGFSN